MAEGVVGAVTAAPKKAFSFATGNLLAFLVLAILLRRFEVMLVDPRPVMPAAVVTTQPDHPALFWFRPRGG